MLEKHLCIYINIYASAHLTSKIYSTLRLFMFPTGYCWKIVALYHVFQLAANFVCYSVLGR